MTTTQKKLLRKKAQQLKPIIIIGQNGYTQAVNVEIEQALSAHQLLKIKIANRDRQVREDITLEICQRTNAVLIQQIGHIIIIHRKKQDN